MQYHNAREYLDPDCDAYRNATDTTWRVPLEEGASLNERGRALLAQVEAFIRAGDRWKGTFVRWTVESIGSGNGTRYNRKVSGFLQDKNQHVVTTGMCVFLTDCWAYTVSGSLYQLLPQQERAE
jgi:hypothetical protein